MLLTYGYYSRDLDCFNAFSREIGGISQGKNICITFYDIILIYFLKGNSSKYLEKLGMRTVILYPPYSVATNIRLELTEL